MDQKLIFKDIYVHITHIYACNKREGKGVYEGCSEGREGRNVTKIQSQRWKKENIILSQNM